MNTQWEKDREVWAASENLNKCIVTPSEQERTGLKKQPQQILHIQARRIGVSGACFILPL